MKLSAYRELERVGEEFGREERECRDHGRYVSIGRHYIGGRIVWSGCPDCLKAQQAQERDRTGFIRQKLTDAGIPRRFIGNRLNDYIPRNDSQAFAKKTILSFAKRFNTEGDGSGLILTGETGTGKTHLCCALVRGLVLKGIHARIFNAIDIIRSVRHAYSGKAIAEDEQIRKFVQPDLLVIDEVGTQMGTNNEMLILFDVVDRRYTDMKSTILVSNMGPDQLLDFISPRIYRRVLGGGVCLSMESGGANE